MNEQIQEVEEQKPLEELSEKELEELAEMAFEDERTSSGSAPTMKEKQDIMNFFNNVLNRSDTTKVSNLSDEELQAVRYMQRAALYANEVDYILVSRYIKKRAEIFLATGLSGKTKGGFFLQIVNTTKKLLETTSRHGTIQQQGGRKGWFGKRN